MNRNIKLVFLDTDYRYGFHCQKFPTYVETIENLSAQSLPYSAFQIYVSNGRSYSLPEYQISDILKSKDLLFINDLYLFVHSCLLHNLCGSVKHSKDVSFESAIKRTVEGLTAEVDIVAALGGKGVIVHPNSCEDVKNGIKTASQTIETVLTQNTKSSRELSNALGISLHEFKRRRCVILENSAREGNKRGGTLEELASMISGVNESVRDQVGICIDTAHAYGAGLYDWGEISEINRFYEDFDRIVGIRYLKVFHLNDSRESTKKADNAFFGSKKDRHENLGEGWIFSDEINPLPRGESRIDGLREFLLQARKRGIPIIGEPPAKSKSGGEGLGRKKDWDFVCEILENTEYPLKSFD